MLGNINLRYISILCTASHDMTVHHLTLHCDHFLPGHLRRFCLLTSTIHIVEQSSEPNGNNKALLRTLEIILLFLLRTNVYMLALIYQRCCLLARRSTFENIYLRGTHYMELRMAGTDRVSLFSTFSFPERELHCDVFVLPYVCFA